MCLKNVFKSRTQRFKMCKFKYKHRSDVFTCLRISFISDTTTVHFNCTTYNVMSCVFTIKRINTRYDLTYRATIRNIYISLIRDVCVSVYACGRVTNAVLQSYILLIRAIPRRNTFTLHKILLTKINLFMQRRFRILRRRVLCVKYTHA